MNKNRLTLLITISAFIVIGAVNTSVYASDSALKALHDFLDIEYDDIKAYGDHYVICHETRSGFSETNEYYGVYDWLNDEWCIEYEAIPYA